jgi:hypothetical protein
MVPRKDARNVCCYKDNPTMKYLIVLTPLLLLACNNSASVSATNASVEEVAEKAKAALKIEPGLWSSSTQILAVDIPGIKDKAMAEQIANSMKNAKATDFTHCVTAAEAEKPSSQMFAGKANGQCKYDNFQMADGRINANMTCTPEGGTMKMAMNGTYSSTAYDMTMNMITSNAQMPGGGMSMKAHTKGARTAACKS